MEKQSDLLFLKVLQDAIDALNSVDAMIETLSERQSKTDCELCDLLHVIENKELTDNACIKITRRIKELREIRRSLRNEYELVTKYQELKNRLSGKESRMFLVNEIKKRMKLLNQDYVNRILTDDDIKELTDEPKPKYEEPEVLGKRAMKNKMINEKIKELLEQGLSQKEIALEVGMTQPSVSVRIKKIREQEV